MPTRKRLQAMSLTLYFSKHSIPQDQLQNTNCFSRKCETNGFVSPIENAYPICLLLSLIKSPFIHAKLTMFNTHLLEFIGLNLHSSRLKAQFFMTTCQQIQDVPWWFPVKIPGTNVSPLTDPASHHLWMTAQVTESPRDPGFDPPSTAMWGNKYYDIRS